MSRLKKLWLRLTGSAPTQRQFYAILRRAPSPCCREIANLRRKNGKMPGTAINTCLVCGSKHHYMLAH